MWVRGTPAEGDGTVTVDILNNIVTASQNPRLNIPVIKLGHVDERFDNRDYFEVEEPAKLRSWSTVALLQIIRSQTATALM